MEAVDVEGHLGHPLGKWGSLNCQVHKTHTPTSHSTAVHHIQPQAMGGPDVPENRVEVCPTGHTNIHMLLALLVKHDGNLSREQTLGYAKHEIDLAKNGYFRWVAAGKPKGRPE